MEEREDDYLKQIDALAKELAERGPVPGRFTPNTKGMEESMLRMQTDMEVVYKDILITVPEVKEMAEAVLAMDENDPARKDMLDKLNAEVQLILDEREREKEVEPNRDDEQKNEQEGNEQEEKIQNNDEQDEDDREI